MKTALLNKVEKYYFLLVVILFVLLFSESFAQNQRVSDVTNSKYALENLNGAIQSANDGVRESAIYLAGEYRFIDTEDALIKQLKVEKIADIKVLIGLALFRMGSEKGMNELQNLAVSDVNAKVRRMSYAIYNEYLVNNFNSKTAER
jgi:hypothetical protein